MKVKRNGQIDITRWAIRDKPALCNYIIEEAERNCRSVRQQMIYMMERYIEVLKQEQNDGK